ncbi:unnamed protein product, partial [Prorocentrum cordatum]
DVAGAGGSVALAARNLTMAVSGVALSVARNSATFVDEAWSGIDLLGCRLNVTGELERITTRVKDAIEAAVDASVLMSPLTAREVIQLHTARPPFWFRLGRWAHSQFDWLRYASGVWL